MKFKKLRKNILLTNKIVLSIIHNGKYLYCKSYETIEDVPAIYIINIKLRRFI